MLIKDSKDKVYSIKNTNSTNSFTDEVVNKQRNIYEAFKFVSVVKNL